MGITFSRLPVVDPTNRCAICGRRIGDPKQSNRGRPDWYEEHKKTRCSKHKQTPLPTRTEDGMNLVTNAAKDERHAQKVMSLIRGRRTRH